MNNVTKLFFAISFFATAFAHNAIAQNHQEEAPVQDSVHQTSDAVAHHDEAPCAAHGAHKTDYTDMMIHHIGNSNELEVVPGVFTLPLPVIVKDENGFQFAMSSAYHADGENAMAHNGYVLNHGVINRIKGDFPKEDTPVTIAHGHEGAVVCHNGQSYALEGSKNLMQESSFYDFSISKNVFTMMLGILLLAFIFIRLANYYKSNSQKAPSGLNAALEVMVVFVRDEIAKPMIGKRYYEFLPLLLTFFFFILVNNLFGLIPFAPFGANVTGNISTTLVLAVIAFIVTNINGTKDYWGHIFWMPGVPVPIKIFLAPIEFLGVFIKPVSLMIRLFANITAGHIIIMSLVGLIFIFGNMGESLPGAFAGGVMAVPFTLFLSIIELVVAFIQAFIFTMLTASYFGAAVEEHHHEKAH